MDELKEMRDAIHSMEMHSEIYMPTYFWKDAAKKDRREFEKRWTKSF